MNLQIRHLIIHTYLICGFGIASVLAQNSEVDKAFSILGAVKSANRFVTQLDSSSAITMPVGIASNDSKDAEQYAILISEMRVSGGHSFLEAYCAFTVPGTSKKIAFKGSDIPFSFGGGIDGVAKLDLVSDFDIPLNSNILLKLLGGGQTSVTFDCFGFKEMSITAAVIFDSTVFVAEAPDGTPLNKPLSATIQTTITNWNEFLVGLSLEPFHLKFLPDIGFSIKNAVFDMSDYSNPVGLRLNTALYQDLFTGGTELLWQGLYIQEAEVRLPPQFSRDTLPDNSTDSVQVKNNNRMTLLARNLIIDELGFTGMLSATNLLTLDEGKMDSWGFSVEEISVKLQASQLIAGSFKGQLRVPEFKENSLLNYTANIGLNSTYSFAVAITDSIELGLWSADLTIEPNSMVDIKVVKGKFIPSLLLNGTLTVNASVNKDNNSGSSLSIAEIGFQGMRISTVEPCFSIQEISYGTSQNKFSNFPVSIYQVGYRSEANRSGLNFGLNVNFVGEEDGGFGGKGEFTIWGKKELGKWKYDGIEIDRILVNVDKGDAFKINGEVLFIRGDSTYGRGFKGEVDATIAGFELNAAALFGQVKGYRYFFADALVALPSGIPAGPISLYGFGGGVSYHMRQNGVGGVQNEIGRSISGIIYEPSKSSGLGVRASVKFGLTGSAAAFNGDVEFGILFNTNGGVDQISFLGNAYFATGDFGVSTSGIMENAKVMLSKTSGAVEFPKDTKNSQLCGDISMLFDFKNKSFHSTFNIYANIAGGIIKGVGPGGLAGWGIVHFDPNDWYIHLGTPDKPNGIEVLGMARMTNYFMAGKSVPELPLPPPEVIQGLGAKGAEYAKQRQTTALGNGSGFALGSYFSFDTGERTFLIFYGRFGMGLGFDILMKNYGEVTCAGRDKPLGINGWYAQGQAYAWIAASMGIKVNLPFYSGKYNILSAQVAALLEAKAPNPFYMRGLVHADYNILNGLVKGKCDFDFEIGEQCKISSSLNPFAGVPIISEIKPSEKQEEVSVFTTPQVIFNMAPNRTIKVKLDDGTSKNFRIVLSAFEIKDSKGNSISGRKSWNSSNDVLVFSSEECLPGEEEITVTATVTFEEFGKNGWELCQFDDSESFQTKTVTFFTDKAPEFIPQENVAYSYPAFQSYNYYKAESSENYIQINVGQDYLFNPGEEWLQKARLVPVSGGQLVPVNFTYDFAGNCIKFSIPSSVEPERIYRLEIFNAPKNLQSALDANVTAISQQIETGENDSEITVQTQQAEGSREELSEKVIYSMVFRTSKYATLKEKFDGLTKSNGLQMEIYPFVHQLNVNIKGEKFDHFEVKNNDADRLISCEPILEETNWYNQYIKPVIDLTDQQLAQMNVGRLTMPWRAAYLFEPITGNQILTNEEAESGISNTSTAFYGMKYYVAKYVDEYINDLKNNVIDFYIMNGLSLPVEIKRLYEGEFHYLTYGQYPVKIHYKNPGKGQRLSSFTYPINFN